MGQGKRNLCGLMSVWANPTKIVIPVTIVRMEISLPIVPGSTMSPKPVFVSVATVK